LRHNRGPQENAQALCRIADAQSGYFTAAQARQAGYACRQPHFHVERGIFRLRDYPPGGREDLIRWSLWSHNQKGIPQAVVSHDTALTVHELSNVMPARVHLTVPPGFRKRLPPGCVLHTGSLAPDDIEARGGYRVTAPLRTLLDVACPHQARRRLDRALAAFARHVE